MRMSKTRQSQASCHQHPLHQLPTMCFTSLSPMMYSYKSSSPHQNSSISVNLDHETRVILPWLRHPRLRDPAVSAVAHVERLHVRGGHDLALVPYDAGLAADDGHGVGAHGHGAEPGPGLGQLLLGRPPGVPVPRQPVHARSPLSIDKSSQQKHVSIRAGLGP